jgi:hypothetical protein
MFAAHGKPIGVYGRGWLAWLISGCFVVMGLVFGARLSDPHFGWKVFGAVMAALCIGYAVRHVACCNCRVVCERSTGWNSGPAPMDPMGRGAGRFART